MLLNIRNIAKGLRQCRDNSNTIGGFIKLLLKSLSTLPLEGRLISDRSAISDGKLYLVQNGKKRWIHSIDIIENLNLQSSAVVSISNKRIQQLSEGDPILSPASKIAVRRNVSKTFICGNGVEIGALHDPLWTPSEATVRYVDIVTEENSKAIFPTLSSFVKVDIIDDGETLATIENGTLDFIIANHFLEHCINPLGTIRNHLQKIRKNGVLYYALPNKDLTFDRDRAITTFEHLVKDDIEGGQISKREHYMDYAKYVDHMIDPEEQKDQARKLEKSDNRIHFHVWDADAINIFFKKATEYLNESCTIEHIEAVDNEVICVLRK